MNNKFVWIGDWLPTCADIAGADISDLNLDGESLIRRKPHEEIPPARIAVIHFAQRENRADKTGLPDVSFASVMATDIPKYKYIVTRINGVISELFYDLANDEDESENLTSIDVHTDILTTMRQHFSDWGKYGNEDGLGGWDYVATLDLSRRNRGGDPSEVPQFWGYPEITSMDDERILRRPLV